MEIGPPIIVLAVICAVAHPAGEWRFEIGRVVETMKDTVCHARHGRLVTANLQLFKAHIEHSVGVGHFFATDGSVAC